ncbi:MAG: hypothetical protein CM15mP39_07620 [Synechococcus sp.]|nr:MAG: hypothetical protein CM15mP39_07620 [Synechococcus sp.]
MDVPKRLYYVDRSQNLLIDLQPGPQLLKGKDLEGFLRWRNDGRGDFGRLERQQLALKGLFEQMKQPQNLIRLPALITAAGQALETDLGPMELGGLVTAMGTTELKASSLRAVPFDADGISYLDTSGRRTRALAPIQVTPTVGVFASCSDQISRVSERTTRPQRSPTLPQRSSLTLVARV